MKSPMSSGNNPAASERPYASAGQRIGLLGGSFDPPHRGHVHISKEAIKAFDLDQVWWLVSPGNPLKSHQPAAMSRRLAAARRLIASPRIKVTDMETRLGTQYTSETLGKLLPLYRDVQFVWLMGADNLAGFHHWQNWRWIMDNVHVGVLARPGERLNARGSKAATVYRNARLKPVASQSLLQQDLPRWCFVNVPMVDAASSEIRAAGQW